MGMDSEREIKNVALLDLTGSTTDDVLDRVARIRNVAAILVPERLLGKLMAIPMENVAATVPVPEGKRVKVMSGQVVLSGEALSAPETDSNDVLVVAGQLVITSPVQQVVRQEIVTMGQVIAPEGSQTGLGAALRRMSGQVLYYPYTPGSSVKVLTGSTQRSGADLANSNGQPTDVLVVVGHLVITGELTTLGFQHIVTIGSLIAPRAAEQLLAGRVTGLGHGVMYYSAPPRVFDGKETFSGAFFELLDEPITLVLDGKFTFEDDVTPQVLKQKVREIVFDGKLIAPRPLVPMLQLLATYRDGRIIASDAADAD
jgi:hypothetical protein